jgi:hypothetical protein
MSTKPILFVTFFFLPIVAGFIHNQPATKEITALPPFTASFTTKPATLTLPDVKVEANPVVEPVSKTEPVVLSAETKDLTPAPKPVVVPPKTNSNISTRLFKLNSGKKVTGEYLLGIVKGNPNGLKLWQAFFDKHGQVVADTAGISLFYENGTLKVDSVGVCSKKYMIDGDYRNCNYADLNSAGFDAGLKQINTFYQRKRIEKLSGIKCQIVNSKDRKDPCTAQYINWLINPNNNIAIALDIYSEQGFTPWYGWKRAFNK